MWDYNYSAGFLSGAAGMVTALCTIAYYVLMAAGSWKIFEKAGEAGWKSLIPVYNSYILYKICWNTNMFWVNLLFMVVGGILTSVPSVFAICLGWAFAMVSIIIYSVRMYRLAVVFGKGIGTFLGLVFFPFIFTLILGFGTARYRGSYAL